MCSGHGTCHRRRSTIGDAGLVPVETVNLFVAFLAIGGLLVLLVGMVVAARDRGQLRVVAPVGLPIALLAATVATAGSLYYSEIAGFVPCRLCWIQRYFMYPLVPLLGGLIAWSGHKRWLRVVPALVAVAGLGVSVYHRLEQQFPDELGGSCSLDNPCSGRWVDTFGVITIPTMAAVAFALVIFFVLVSFEAERNGVSPHD